MIESVYFPEVYGENSKSRVGGLPAIKKKSGLIEFKPGLNIIVGPNGSGKTSILNEIADNLAANDLGCSVITQNWLLSRMNGLFSKGLKVTAEIIHDGQVIYYGDPKRKVGYSNGQPLSEFSIESALEGFNSSSESSGECSERRIDSLMRMLSEKPESTDICAFSDSVYEHLKRDEAILKSVHDAFYPKIPKGQVTVLFDEPEAGLGIMSQILLWNKLKKAAAEGNYQIILVSHSFQCLDIEGAHYIELKDGYRKACLDAFNNPELTNSIKECSFSVVDSLSSYQKGIMKKMYNEGSIEFKKQGESLSQLVELKLVDSTVVRVESKDEESVSTNTSPRNRSRSRFRRSREPENCRVNYYLTAKGRNYTQDVLLD